LQILKASADAGAQSVEKVYLYGYVSKESVGATIGRPLHTGKKLVFS